MKANDNLGLAADTTKETARAALDWLQKANNRALVGDQAARLERALRLGIVNAGQLSKAARRPMAVAVFGASQVGKSHLISVLARKGDALMARFQGMEKPVNYITTINPDRGKEATGLVTRFTIRDPKAAPDGFPVHLRLLSHADLIKIFANAYFFDGQPGRYETWPTEDEIKAFLAPFRNGVAQGAGDSGEPNGLTIEDIWGLEEYFNKTLAEFELTKRLGSFWVVAADIAPRLSLPKLAEFLSLLWGRHQAISDVYLNLVKSLQGLNFAEEVFVPFSAIDISAEDQQSILDVETLSDIIEEDAVKLDVATPNGKIVALNKPIITALTAELLINLADNPWPFFEHTDLLDFPGYRTRGLPQGSGEDDEGGTKGLARFLSEAPRETMASLILRGKVEYLFQRYCNEQDITAMLFCVKESNLDVNQLADVAANWIATTHGARPNERIGKPPLLYFVLTRFDMHFEKKANDSSMGLKTRFEGRMMASLIKPFGSSPDSWVKQWTPNEPFRNMFLMRNPNVMNADMFTFDGGREVDIREDRKDWVKELRDGFLETDYVQEHFNDPQTAFDEMMRVNDGGASYIAKSLAPVCRPEIKYQQIAFRLNKLNMDLLAILKPFYTTTDLGKRLAEREEIARNVVDALYTAEENYHRFGTLLRGLMLDNASITDQLYEALIEMDRHPISQDAVAAPSAPRRLRPWEKKENTGDESSDAVPVEPSANNRREGKFVSAAIATWISHLYRQVDNPHFLIETKMDPSHLREMVDDIVFAAKRLKMTDIMAETIKRVAFVDRRDEQISKAALVSERFLNRFIADLGVSLMEKNERPKNDYAEPPRIVFDYGPSPFNAKNIGLEPATPYLTTLEDWAIAFMALASDNAKSEEGLTIDIEQNAALGRIIDALHPVE
ncbi:virulence factor SrfC family protein [Bartonella sp. HY761]|uniref:virulence factor SrfC family protein n=1 Tax=Bartonella sp. HY761 TaxID=2979330 RepID=UPI0022030734|nr:virulence factor SrfC family protein [Bartonella sp. HY761]UXN05869.1 putative virulence factor [Bartonella sp. HY761]